MLATKIHKEIEALPDEALEEVKKFIEALKVRRATKDISKKKTYNVFDAIADAATDVGIKDLARNHDHYLYGTEKR